MSHGPGFKQSAGGALGAAWDLLVKGELPKGVKQALTPCERCKGARRIDWRGQAMPCPVCCDEEGRVK